MALSPYLETARRISRDIRDTDSRAVSSSGVAGVPWPAIAMEMATRGVAGATHYKEIFVGYRLDDLLVLDLSVNTRLER